MGHVTSMEHRGRNNTLNSWVTNLRLTIREKTEKMGCDTEGDIVFCLSVQLTLFEIKKKKTLS